MLLSNKKQNKKNKNKRFYVVHDLRLQGKAQRAILSSYCLIFFTVYETPIYRRTWVDKNVI
jgi:hypothetical protein